jgi:hypothetical protein
MDQSEDQTPHGCEESDEGSRGCSREAADDRQHLEGRWAAHLWRGHHDLQRATPRGRDPAEHKGVSRGRFETRPPLLGERRGAQCPPHNVKNGRRMASPLKATAQPYVPRGAKTLR